MTGLETYPLRVTADLDQPLSRWLWLVVLAFLWLAVVVLSVVALVTIVVAGHYPAPPFRLDIGGHETGTVAHASQV